jgi:hypothetical protein
MSSRQLRDRRVSVIVFMAGAILLSITAPSMSGPNSSSSPFPGLELVDSKSVDRLYRRPDVDISDYNKIRVGEPVVEFSKSWNPRNYGTFGLSAAQLNKIRVDMAALAKSIFIKVLREGGYDVVTESGAGVLYITPNIVDLYITAPDTLSPGRSRTYVMDAGSMSLALQINDAVTGTLLAVAYDRQRGSQFGKLQWASSVSNKAAASAVLKGWAEQLKSDLDASRAK